MKTAAWSVPVIVAAVASPAASASLGEVDLGAFRLDASCALTGLDSHAFTLSAEPGRPLPVGTVGILETADAEWWPAYGGYYGAYVHAAWSSGEDQLIFTLIAELPEGTPFFFARGDMTGKTFIATITLPPGYIGTGAKTSAVLDYASGVCSAG